MTYQTESESESCLVMSDSLRPHGLYSPWNSPGQNTGVGSLPLFQGIFPTQVSNTGIKPRSPALQADFLPAEPQGKPNTTGVEYTLDFEGLVPKKLWNISEPSSDSFILMCYCSVTRSCSTLCSPMDCSTPGFPVHHQLPEFAQTHVH